MKNIYLTISLCVAMAFSAGCSKDNRVDCGMVDCSSLKMTAEIESRAKVSWTEADNILKSFWEEGDVIKGYYVDENSAKKPVTLIVSAVDGSGIATIELGEGFPDALPSGTEIYMFYVPGDTELTDDGTFTLEWAEQDGAADSVFDNVAYMVADKVVVKNNGTLSVVFHNVMSLIRITNPKGNDGQPLAAGTTLTLSAVSGLYTSGVLSKNGIAGLEYGSITTAVQDGAASYIAIPRLSETIMEFSFSYNKGGKDYYWISSEDVVPSSKTGFTLTDKVLDRVMYNGHEYVDLGLTVNVGGVDKPLYFAARNIGAAGYADKGSYFKWAETEIGENDLSVTWGSENGSNNVIEGDGRMWYYYTHCNISKPDVPYNDNKNGYKYLTKYITDKQYTKGGEGKDSDVDNITVMQSEDDAATVQWGGKWKTPSMEEMQLLNSITTKEGKSFTASNGKSSWCVEYTANGHSLVLPATGIVIYNGISGALFKMSENCGYTLNYWTTELATPCINACCTNSDKNGTEITSSTTQRNYGVPVRPVFIGD